MLARFSADHEGERLDRALANLFPQYSRSFLAKLIADRAVRVDGAPTEKASRGSSAGQFGDLAVPPPVSSEVVPKDLPLKILFEDDSIVVIDKPPGIVVHPAAGHADRTLVNALLFHVKDL